MSLVLSAMSDVRAAFQTNDRATIRDTAAEIWSKVSQSSALFLVTDPHGEVIASLGGGQVLGRHVDVVRDGGATFSRADGGFALGKRRLYELVVTPVYVQTQKRRVCSTCWSRDFRWMKKSRRISRSDRGKRFRFSRRMATRWLRRCAPAEAKRIAEFNTGAARNCSVQMPADGEFAVLGSTLRNIEGAPVGDLLIVHSFESIQPRSRALQRKLLSDLGGRGARRAGGQRIARPPHSEAHPATR